VNIAVTQVGSLTNFTDSSGAPTHSDFHVVEADTFSANGVTLTGTPFVNQ
jgi:hypothetical protein